MLENNLSLWLDRLPQPNASSHKYSRGHAMIYGGHPVTGAARLAALSAARIGAGLTSIVVPEIAFPIYATSMLSIMVKPYSDDEGLSALISEQKANAYLVGPGAGVNDKTKVHVQMMLSTKNPVVIDADGISVFGGDIQSLVSAIEGECVITPHEGEFVRLFGAIGDRAEAAQKAANITGAIVILKGHETIIAAPNGELVVNRNSSPYLATAGSGDVLAGMVTGLLAQRMPAFSAATAAVWLHGECARELGVGLIAEDIPKILPQVLAKIMTR
jgi:ADP-dependent NAD(P)H-hydrate dehydratase / NAD(P)H-hydrate epimerase